VCVFICVCVSFSFFFFQSVFGEFEKKFEFFLEHVEWKTLNKKIANGNWKQQTKKKKKKKEDKHADIYIRY